MWYVKGGELPFPHSSTPLEEVWWMLISPLDAFTHIHILITYHFCCLLFSLSNTLWRSSYCRISNALCFLRNGQTVIYLTISLPINSKLGFYFFATTHNTVMNILGSMYKNLYNELCGAHKQLFLVGRVLGMEQLGQLIRAFEI